MQRLGDNIMTTKVYQRVLDLTHQVKVATINYNDALADRDKARALLERCLVYKEALEHNVTDQFLDASAAAELQAKSDLVIESNYDKVTELYLESASDELDADIQRLDAVLKTPPDHDCTVDLPHELLVYIFNHLDHDTLLVANLVNRHWHHVVSKTPALRRLKYTTRFEADDVMFQPLCIDGMSAQSKYCTTVTIAGQDGHLWVHSRLMLIQLDPNTKRQCRIIRNLPVSVIDGSLVAVSPCGHAHFKAWNAHIVIHWSTPSRMKVYPSFQYRIGAALSARTVAFFVDKTVVTYDFPSKSLVDVVKYTPATPTPPSFQTHGVYIPTSSTGMVFYDYKTFQPGPVIPCDLSSWRHRIQMLNPAKCITVVYQHGLRLFRHSRLDPDHTVRWQLSSHVVTTDNVTIHGVVKHMVVGERLILVATDNRIFVC
jgi:hypothetical protein